MSLRHKCPRSVESTTAYEPICTERGCTCETTALIDVEGMWTALCDCCAERMLNSAEPQTEDGKR